MELCFGSFELFRESGPHSEITPDSGNDVHDPRKSYDCFGFADILDKVTDEAEFSLGKKIVETKGESNMADKIAVLGIYPNYSSVENAVDALKAAGFRNTDISVLFPEKVISKKFARKKGTKAPEGAVAGAGTGAVVGGTLGWLVGIGALAIPGLGPFIAAGPLMAALAGVGVGGTVGGIAGALIGMGIPEHEAKRYEVRVKEGGILLSVHSDNAEWTKRAKEVLERTGAQDISSTGEGAVNYVRAPVASAKETSRRAKDLVCGMTVDDNSPHRSTHAGQTYVFCSPNCKQEFDKEPERYVAPAR